MNTVTLLWCYEPDDVVDKNEHDLTKHFEPDDVIQHYDVIKHCGYEDVIMHYEHGDVVRRHMKPDDVFDKKNEHDLN